MARTLGLFVVVAALVVASWWWRGAPVTMPPSPLSAGEKLPCVSYAPFRGQQTPLDPTTRIDAAQIDEDLALLAKLTTCIRIYSVDLGLDQVPQIAERHGLKVLLGIWVSGRRDKTQWQIETGVALANRFPKTIQSLIVGNEVLLRGEVAAASLADNIRQVKAQVRQPVTYADVWEFWMRNSELAEVVDFITIHILPYWEDHPIAAERAADHVVSIRGVVAAAFPGREILIGEAGWPSAGRMREAARASPVSQARAVHDLLARAKAENFRVNVIEAFDQPWKRLQEGTVGGHWGIIDAARRIKFAWGEPVSNHPHWPWQAAGGVVFAALVFAAAMAARRQGQAPEPNSQAWIAVAAIATVSGMTIGWIVEGVLLESLGFSGWLNGAMRLGVALAVPLAGAVAIFAHVRPATFACVLRPAATARTTDDSLALILGVLLVVTSVLAVQTALSLAFNPRYLDFPYAAQTGTVLPFLLLSFLRSDASGARATAETTAAAVLVPSAIFVCVNEGLANWQSVWLCAALLALAIILARVRAAPDRDTEARRQVPT
ncbi:MAG: beta-(1-6) glucans synthase [Hyphomicrobiaceae bacterium]